MAWNRGRAPSGVVGGLGAALIGVGVFAAVRSGLSWADLVGGFVVSSLVLGAVLLAAGLPIARADPRSAVGWLLAAAGVFYATSGAGYAVLAWGTQPGDDGALWRVVADVTSVGWPLAVFGAIPAAFVCFPRGRPPVRGRWAVVSLLAVGCAVGVAAMTLGEFDTTSELGVAGYLQASAPEVLRVLMVVSTVLAIAEYLMVAVVLGVRYAKGGDKIRRQILWVFVASVIALVEPLVEMLLRVETLASVLVLALPALATGVAILRYQLVDITLVASRFTLYLALTIVGVLVFTGLVTLADALVSDRLRFAPPVLTALVIALAFDPARRWLQVRLDRMFYGSHENAGAVVTQITGTLAQRGITDASVLSSALADIATRANVPWADLLVDGVVVAGSGSDSPEFMARDMALGGGGTATLRVGLRRGQHAATRADTRMLDAVAPMVSVAWEATEVAKALARARRDLARARDDGRRRLRRDLHDGVGPSLAVAALQVNAAKRLTAPDNDGAQTALSQAGGAVAAASAEVRRLVESLRPPALDSLGLLPAIREHARGLGSLAVDVSADADADQLAPEVEVVAFRIVVEALTNVVRHAQATSVAVSLERNPEGLRIRVADDGPGGEDPWVAGVGLSSMSERAAEIGGTLLAGPTSEGGRVEAWLPQGAP